MWFAFVCSFLFGYWFTGIVGNGRYAPFINRKSKRKTMENETALLNGEIYRSGDLIGIKSRIFGQGDETETYIIGRLIFDTAFSRAYHFIASTTTMSADGQLASPAEINLLQGNDVRNNLNASHYRSPSAEERSLGVHGQVKLPGGEWVPYTATWSMGTLSQQNGSYIIRLTAADNRDDVLYPYNPGEQCTHVEDFVSPARVKQLYPQ